eukprot:gnl/Chilomastix_cuspidata/1245.p1 GENE.gnl/Chilomastix_cuspidata/1245~~gnl/Chilomastix_cuspidata/1245.p1  ORF type:complete len:894 (+),score=424.98 gnl/Chilomastix_cuspidata/1245:504-3185(+)
MAPRKTAMEQPSAPIDFGAVPPPPPPKARPRRNVHVSTTLLNVIGFAPKTKPADSSGESLEIQEFLRFIDDELVVTASNASVLKDLPQVKTGDKKVSKEAKVVKQLLAGANSAFAVGSYDLAKKCCLEVVRIHPAIPAPYDTLSVIYRAQGDTHRSLGLAMIAASLDAKEPLRRWNECVEIAVREQLFGQAIYSGKRYIRHLRHTQDYDELEKVCTDLFAICVAEQRPKDALYMLEILFKATEGRPEQRSRATQLLSRAYVQFGQEDAAIKFLTREVEENFQRGVSDGVPIDLHSVSMLCDLNFVRGNYSDVVGLLARLDAGGMEAHPEITVKRHLAVALNGDISALKLATDRLETLAVSENPDLYLMTARSAHELGEERVSCQLYGRLVQGPAKEHSTTWAELSDAAMQGGLMNIAVHSALKAYETALPEEKTLRRISYAHILSNIGEHERALSVLSADTYDLTTWRRVGMPVAFEAAIVFHRMGKGEACAKLAFAPLVEILDSLNFRSHVAKSRAKVFKHTAALLIRAQRAEMRAGLASDAEFPLYHSLYECDAPFMLPDESLIDRRAIPFFERGQDLATKRQFLDVDCGPFEFVLLCARHLSEAKHHNRAFILVHLALRASEDLVPQRRRNDLALLHITYAFQAAELLLARKSISSLCLAHPDSFILWTLFNAVTRRMAYSSSMGKRQKELAADGHIPVCMTYAISANIARAALTSTQSLVTVTRALPFEPLPFLLLATHHAKYTHNKAVANRTELLCKALAALSHYVRVRGPRTAEASYNVGRLFHFLGALGVAQRCYWNVLRGTAGRTERSVFDLLEQERLSPSVEIPPVVLEAAKASAPRSITTLDAPPDRPSADFRYEAAFNLFLLYQYVSSTEAALAVLHTHLVV